MSLQVSPFCLNSSGHIFIFLLVITGIKLRALHIWDKHSSIELIAQPRHTLQASVFRVPLLYPMEHSASSKSRHHPGCTPHVSMVPVRLTNVVWQEANTLISWGWMAGRPPPGVSARFPAHSCCARGWVSVSAFDWETTQVRVGGWKGSSWVGVREEGCKPWQ